ncbi:uncharacterized protein LOC120697017 [Panicum virgatum]|uniref:Uncharacterized protein n=1 Tax=Panicum virgatum TaxID=38727 RepID=A0A8T0UTY8_PANVG|nr:uncharacterized protein LOC120697017 [Panicum virgatum]KAG2623659.1 hypothetical protein PVAP13_3KG072700 [Panicum virgatum]
MAETRGSIAFFTTYRPAEPFDIFSCPANPQLASAHSEVPLTDGVSYNQNCRPIPAAALSELLTFLAKKNPEAASRCGATPADADAGRVTGLVFVSERDDGLETLHVALRFTAPGKVPVVLRLADIYGADTFGGARMEDSGCIAGGFEGEGGRAVGHSLVYVSTKEPVRARRTPWTVVYKTNFADGRTERLTPPGQYDLSPAVSPSGKMVAVASFKFHRWTGEIERLKTDIVVMNVDRQAQGGLRRKVLIRDGGWPSWGSDGVIFFHRGIDKTTLPSGDVQTTWGVFRYDMATGETVRVTPEAFDAVTPAAISETKVAVATIRQKVKLDDARCRVEEQYRNIEIFDVTAPNDEPARITQQICREADFYNPFILDGGARVGYHRCRTTCKDGTNNNSVSKKFHKLQSPKSHEDVGLFRVSGVFPTISKDGSKLAFVDNSFKAVWLADGPNLHKVHERRKENSIFSIVWNQNPEKDTLYVCIGPSFDATKPLEIYAIINVSKPHSQQMVRRLTNGNFNNAFPSSNPKGTKFVFRSTRDGGNEHHKNLYIMEDSDIGEFGEGTVRRLTNGPWTDTHCSWSPRGDWIVFSSSRDRPADAPKKDILDPGFFAIFLVNANDPDVIVRVMKSSDTIAGHVTHPMFSPDMRSIVVTADLAAVSTEPISMPQFLHSVRPYGDVFTVNIRDTDDISKNEDIEEFHRITHSRYEYATPAWTKFATDDPNTQWSELVTKSSTGFGAACPR